MELCVPQTSSLPFSAATRAHVAKSEIRSQAIEAIQYCTCCAPSTWDALISGGEYTLKVRRSAEYQGDLAVYYGDVFFEKDAKPIHLGDGEEDTGADITVGLSKLHSISGSFINLSGQPINSGHIVLFAVPGNIKIVSAFVNEKDATFHMDLAPEGHYTLSVTEVRDVNLKIIRDDKDPNQIQDIKRTVLQTYSDYQAPLEVLSDLPSLTLSIPSKSR